MISFALAAVLLSLGWSLRGQFGHLEGALIPGALAAVAAVAAGHNRRWRGAFGAAALFGAAGFALGGHFGYGALIEHLVYAPNFFADGRLLLRLFLIGALWGGLGFSFLGLAFNEKGFTRTDLYILIFLALLWFVPLGIFNRDHWDIRLFAAGLTLLHVYNFFWKKSSMIAYFAVPGVFAVSGGFLTAVFLLHAGEHGWIGGPWDWWRWRDQMIGLAAGAAVWTAVRFAVKDGFEPAPASNHRLYKAGWVVFLAVVPLIIFFNAFKYWMQAQALSAQFGALLVTAAFMLSALMILVSRRAAADFDTAPGFSLKFFFAVFYVLLLFTFLAIMKESLVFGPSRWEAAYSLFIADIFLAAFLLPATLYGTGHQNFSK